MGFASEPRPGVVEHGGRFCFVSPAPDQRPYLLLLSKGKKSLLFKDK
jgi:hypothetical protein